MKERHPSRCIFHAYSATSATFVSQVEIETPNYIYLVFSPCVIYENVDNVFIEIYRICEVFKETLISFNNKKLRHWKGRGKGTQSYSVLWELLTELFIRSYFQQSEL